MQTDYTFGWKQTFSSSGEFGGEGAKGDEQLKNTLDDIQNSSNIGDAASAGAFQASGSFSCSVTPEIGFRLRISQRYTDQNRGNYFEDLVFYFKVDWDVYSTITIATPVGINILIDLGTDGKFAGVYHMYMDYPERFHEEGAQPFTSEDFSLFANKPTTSSYLRREGYIFLDPAITVGLGVGAWIINVKCDAHFKFDTEFKFRSGGIDAYGDLTYDIFWIFEAAGFTIYKFQTPFNAAASAAAGKDLNIQTIKLFNTPGTNDHIRFDFEIEPTLNAALQDVMSQSLSGAETTSLKDARPSSRDYLDYRSAWRGDDNQAVLMNAEGSEETELRSGVNDNLYINLLPIENNGDLLMIYIDDGGENRENINKRAAYYSIYNASERTWSEPEIILDDGTPDEYPTAQDLGNGQILVAWSSADQPLPDDATLEDMLQAMNIQAAFFDISSRAFGEVETLTHTTDEDFSADLMPKAAFDPETGRVILYYSKTEFVDLDALTDLGAAYSSIAYLFYQYNQDGKTGVWRNTGDDYSEQELQDIGDYWKSLFPPEENQTPEEYEQELQDYLESYKINWYGQRSLDTRLDDSSGETPRVIDSGAIGYNGLALYAYTVDWDGLLNTSDDRDVFLQIYNFSENSFSHIIRVTPESGSYTLPQFARSENNTYLFYGEKSQDSERGAIRYLNISYFIRNEFYEKVTNGDNEYYILRVTKPEVTLDAPDSKGSAIIPAVTEDISADIAADCGSLTDFDAFVDPDGRIYLLWSASDNQDGCEIYAAVLNATDEPDIDINEEENPDDGKPEEAAWSAPIALTDGGENVFYTGLGAIAYDGKIFTVAGKQEILERSKESDGENVVKNSMIQVTHTPFSHIELDNIISVDNLYAKTGDIIAVSAVLKNTGLETLPVDENGVAVKFYINGEDAGEAVYDKFIPGGVSVSVTAHMETPDAENIAITAEYDGATADIDLKKEALLDIQNGASIPVRGFIARI